jgi:hypothetical protein
VRYKLGAEGAGNRLPRRLRRPDNLFAKRRRAALALRRGRIVYQETFWDHTEAFEALELSD